MTHKFDVRITKVLNESELLASLRGGWDENLPAIKDEHGNVLVGNRRLALARRDGIEPVIKVVKFGEGPDADAARIRLANVSNIGAAPLTAEDRKTQAVSLYESGLTQMAIANMLGVSQDTIKRDLTTVVKSNHAKTATNPKGSGRPKGTVKTKEAKETKPEKPKEEKPVRKPAAKPRTRVSGESKTPVLDKARDIVRPLVWAGEPCRSRMLEAEHDISHVQFETAWAVEVALKDEPSVDPETLAKTSQEKIAAALKQERRKLEVEIEHKVRAENMKWLQRQLDQYNKNAQHYEAVIKVRKGIMDKTKYNLVRSCLHADSRKSVSDEKLNRAFHVWSDLEKVLVSEKENPTTPSGLPLTAADLMKRKEEYIKQRAAERAAKKGSATNNVERR